MNPAPSVILFTTLSGAGYGMAAVAGLLWPALGPTPPALALTTMGLALTAIVIGLSASVFHLGRPERAWRALSQWRTSWLSREGIAALAGFPLIAAFAVAWAFPIMAAGATLILGIAAAAASFLTLFTTAMIYRSLKPIAAWHHPLVTPIYMVLGPMTGALAIHAIATANGVTSPTLTAGALALLVAGGTLKTLYWRSIDADRGLTTADAIGLPGATARSIEWPHTEANYLLKEMSFVIARRHAARLRRVAGGLGWIVPGALIILGLTLSGVALVTSTIAAALSSIAGVIVERWLFFAEARHTVSLYYGR